MAGRKTKYTPETVEKHKATEAEMEARVSEVYTLILGGTGRPSILQHAAKKWDIKTRQTDELIARANAEFKKLSAVVFEVERGKAIARAEKAYQVATLKNDVHGMIKASQELAKLHGLYAPTQTEITGANGGPVRVEVEYVDSAGGEEHGE